MYPSGILIIIKSLKCEKATEKNCSMCVEMKIIVDTCMLRQLVRVTPGE
jgi:hypothetical protein